MVTSKSSSDTRTSGGHFNFELIDDSGEAWDLAVHVAAYLEVVMSPFAATMTYMYIHMCTSLKVVTGGYFSFNSARYDY